MTSRDICTSRLLRKWIDLSDMPEHMETIDILRYFFDTFWIHNLWIHGRYLAYSIWMGKGIWESPKETYIYVLCSLLNI